MQVDADNSHSPNTSRRWAWYNSGLPKGNDKVSLLAICETILIVTVYAYIALRFGTLHLTISACIAPFLLLRTDQSTSLGMTIGRSVWPKIVKYIKKAMDVVIELCPTISDFKDYGLYNFIVSLLSTIGFACAFIVAVFLFVILIMLITVVAIGTRIIATVVTVIQHPIQSIISIPVNWWRFVAIVDSTTLVEVLPGITEEKVESGFHGYFDVSKIINDFKKDSESPYFERIFLFFMVIIYVLVVWFPAFTYRLMVKGTALIYSPLIYIIHGSFASNFNDRLLAIRSLALYRVMRVYAAITILLLSASFFY